MRPRIHVANPGDKSWCPRMFLFTFGAYGETRVIAYGSGMDSALDEAIDWLADNAPGLLADGAVQEEYELAIREGCTEEQAIERAELDTTQGGNCGHYLFSWEWWADEVTPATLKKRVRGWRR